MSTPQQPWAQEPPRSPSPQIPLPLPPERGKPFFGTPMGVLMIGLALALLAGAITFVITLIRNNRTPTVSIPTATMPTPNAFDTYVAAGKAIVRKDEISSAFAEKNQGQKLTDDQKAALVDANREPLKAIRTGLALPYRR